MYYLGTKVDGLVDDKLRIARNKAKHWKYGYDEIIDTVIISRDGTLGNIYCVNGLNIGLPEIPDKKEILNNQLSKNYQKWGREELPEELDDSAWDFGDLKGDKLLEAKEFLLNSMYDKYESYIEKQDIYRYNGCWVYINGQPIYLTGTYWYFLQWVRIEEEYPNFRIIQSELMIFWEACKADSRSLGMIYVKNRRFGASSLAVAEILESGSIYKDKHLGLISKTGEDASDIFDRIITAFLRLPFFLRPSYDGTSRPKTVLNLNKPSKKLKVGETAKNEGLNTTVKWYNTAINSMDGKRVFRSLIDEAGKFPVEVPFDKYWGIVKTSHLKGRVLFGKSMVVSTVNDLDKGGREYKNIYDGSDLLDRDGNGRTITGLYRIFIPAEYCLEGYFDEFGFSIVEDPEKPIKADDGEIVSIGAKTYLKNIEISLEEKPDELNEQLRQFPHTESDAFRPTATESAFNLTHILEQIKHNEQELEDNGKGNNAIERGNLSWKNGINDGEVIWTPDPVDGRFWIVNGCHPSTDIRNKKIKRTKHGITSFAPANEHVGCIGVDPFNRSKTVDGRGSDGAMHLHTKDNPYFPNNTFIMEYLFRPKKVELFFEDVIMAMVYWGVPILPESANDNFLRYLVERGYRWFILNDPNKKSWKELSQHEKDFGGVNPQGSKIRDTQFYAIHSYIEDSIGVARNFNNRPKGEMGFMPFNRTISQWKDTDPDNRTRFDAYISSSLAVIGNRRVIKEEKTPPPLDINPFQTYDNSGYISKAI